MCVSKGSNKRKRNPNRKRIAVERPPCVQHYCITMINVRVNITHGN